MVLQEILILALFSIGFNLLMFIPAYLYKTDKLTDISYSLTFLAIATYVLFKEEFYIEKLVVFAMIAIWAIRLGGYLLNRIHKMGRDKRFDEMRSKFWSFFGFWLLQGISVFIISIPSAFFLLSKDVSFTSISFFGIFIWAAGLLIEAFADNQKFQFKLKEANANKWPEHGLWKYSRHPNYLGEILVWIGLFITSFQALSQNQAIIGLISPLFIIILLLFISGIPLLEQKHQEKWGNSLAYQTYKKTTGKVVPKYTFSLLLSIIIPQIIGGAGAYFTMSSVNNWYLTLNKPVWNPPSWVFGPVWTLLYALMGIAAFMIWRKRKTIQVKKALWLYGLQLLLNLLWSILFFGKMSPEMAFIEIIFLWVLIFLTIKAFYKIDKVAAYLLIPYLLWVTFASILNLTIWILN